MRIATLDGIQPSALKDLNEVLSKVLAGRRQASGRSPRWAALKTAAEIINLMGSSVETAALDYIREADQRAVRRRSWTTCSRSTTQNKLDTTRAFQSLLKEVAVRVAGHRAEGRDAPELREKVFRQHVQPRRRGTLREDLESRGPVRLSEVEAEQKEMLKVVRRLVDEGQIDAGQRWRRRDGVPLNPAIDSLFHSPQYLQSTDDFDKPAPVAPRGVACAVALHPAARHAGRVAPRWTHQPGAFGAACRTRARR